MASDHLVVELSDVLRDALHLPTDRRAFDYFTFFGLDKDNITDEAVEKAVLRRSRALRTWQNSPHHSEEAIKLLPAIHRIAKVLRDPRRRQAYTTELERLMSGLTEEPEEVFESMVRTALADGVMDQASRVELLRFARSNNIEDPEQIIGRISKAAPGPRAGIAGGEKAISFDDYNAGAAGFRRAINYLLSHGRLTAESGAKAVEVSGRFKVDQDQAKKILDEARREYFTELAESSATGGVLSNNQARLLMPKAKALGLGLEAAYEIVSEYTFTNVTQADLSEMRLASAAFADSEIESILDRQETVYFNPKLTLVDRLKGWPMQTAKVLLVLGVVGFGGLWVYENFLSYWIDDLIAGRDATELEVVSEVASESVEAWKPPKPDSPSGRLTLLPLSEADPPAFEIKIDEVSRSEYQEFLIASFHPAIPIGWSGALVYPEGTGEYPVTGIAWSDAAAYCQWVAKRFRLPKGRVRPPSVGEYERVLKESLVDGMDPRGVDFDEASGFDERSIGPRRGTKYDVFLLDSGQIYDLLGNASEWGVDTKAGKKAVLGGHYSVGGRSAELNHLDYIDPSETSEVIGFRYVISPPIGK